MHGLWVMLSAIKRVTGELLRVSKEFNGVFSDTTCLVGEGQESLCELHAFRRSKIAPFANKDFGFLLGKNINQLGERLQG